MSLVSSSEVDVQPEEETPRWRQVEELVLPESGDVFRRVVRDCLGIEPAVVGPDREVPAAYREDGTPAAETAAQGLRNAVGERDFPESDEIAVLEIRLPDLRGRDGRARLILERTEATQPLLRSQ